MAIKKFRAGRVSSADASTWIGEPGTMFYDEATGQLKIADGTTPGGSYIPLVIATPTRAGAIKAGPGANVAVDGTLTIDTTGLPLSVGNLSIVDTTISTAVANVDLNIVTNGPSANVNLVGAVHIHTRDQWDQVHDGNAVMTVSTEGFVTIRTPTVTSTNAGLMIIGSTSGNIQPAGGTSTGRMIHVTGNDGMSARHTMDAFGTGAFASFIGRSARGTADSPLPLQAGDLMMRLSSTGWAEPGYNTTNTGGPPTSIDFVATDNYTHSVYGSAIKFYTSPQGSIARTLSLTVDTTGITATRFVGNVVGNTISVTGNVNAGNLIATTYYGNIVGTSSTLSGNLTAGYVSGKLIRAVRGAGTIADNGTLTIDFSADEVVHCMWGNGLNLAYTNYQAGRVVKVMATKSSGTGTDSISLDGVTAAQVSSGSTSITAAADTTTFIELICTGTTLGSVYIKL